MTGDANTKLTDRDRELIAKARDLAGLTTTAKVRDRFPGWSGDTAAEYAEAFGTARWLIEALANRLEHLGS